MKKTHKNMTLGMALGTLKDNAVNKQLEEQTVIVSKCELESETLSVGDIVYLGEDGSLEQAYDNMEV